METIEIIAIILSLLVGWDKVEDRVADEQLEQQLAALESSIGEKERDLMVAINGLQNQQTSFDRQLMLFRQNVAEIDSAYKNLDMSQSQYVELIGRQIAILSAEARHLSDSYAQLDNALSRELSSHADRTDRLRKDLNAAQSTDIAFSDKATARYNAQQAELMAKRNEVSSQQALIEELRRSKAILESELQTAHEAVGRSTESLSQLGEELEAAKLEKDELSEGMQEAQEQSQSQGMEIATLKKAKTDVEGWRDLLGGGTALGALLSAVFGGLFGKRRGDTVQYRRAINNLITHDQVDSSMIVNALLAQGCKRIPREHQLAQNINA